MPGKAKAPAIRFKGFTDAWEQRKVGELIEDYFEKTFIQSQYPVLTSSQQQGILLQEDYFADRQVTTNDNIGYFVLPKGYFTYRSRSDTDLFVFNRNDVIDRGIISYYYPVFKVKDTDSNFFLRRINHGMNRQIAMAAEGTGQHVLSHRKFKNMITIVPTIAEQEKIGILFEQVDNLITLHQCKLLKLKNVKKAMLEKMFPKNGSNVPEIRLAGFTDDWEQRKFSETFISLQNNSLSRADLNYEKGLVKNVHYGDVLIKFGEILDVEKDEIPFISNNEFNTSSASLLQNGDVIIADAAEDETVGKCSEIIGMDGMSVVSGLHTIPCRPSKTFSTGYLGYYMNSRAYHDQLLPLIQGTKISSISKSALQGTDIIYPVSEKEQLQIGQFFQNLDNLITLHQRKYEKLQNLKKACLEKMLV